MNGAIWAGFAAVALVGHSEAYPDMPFDELMNTRGERAVEDVKKNCLLATLALFAGAKVEDLTKDKLSIDDIRKMAGPDGTTWGEIGDRAKLGVGIGPEGSGVTYEIGFPVFQYRGWFEEIIPHETTDATRKAYCDAGIKTRWKNTFPGEHLSTDWFAADEVTNWFTDRFNGKPEPGNC